MRKLIVLKICLLFCLIAPCSAISQTLKPRISIEAGKQYFCFDSTQASYIAKQISLTDLYQDKIQALEAIEQNLEREIDARQEAYHTQTYELIRANEANDIRQRQIDNLQAQILAYQKGERKARKTKLAYKALTGVLAITTLYLIIKK